MHPRVLSLLVCAPLLAALAVLTLSTARATPMTAAPNPRAAHPDPVATRLATGAGALAGAALATWVLRRAPAPDAPTPR